MATQELVKKPAQPETNIPSNPTPMDLLSLALSHGAAIDVIERLAALQDKAMARNAEQEFTDAMNAAQTELGRIAPDLENPQTHSKYASYAALDRKLRPIYTKHGFSLSFDSGESPLPETVIARCYVSHRGGHTRTYTSPPIPADGKGAKGNDVMTKTHATGAAMSYGMRYLLKFIFNVAVGQEDDDGNLGQGWVLAKVEDLYKCRNIAELRKMYADYLTEAKNARAAEAMLTITQAFDKQKAELQKAGQQ